MKRKRRKLRSAAGGRQYDPATIYALVTCSDFGFVFSNDDPRMLKTKTHMAARRTWPQYREHILKRIKENDLELPGFGWLPKNSAERLQQSLGWMGIEDNIPFNEV